MGLVGAAPGLHKDRQHGGGRRRFRRGGPGRRGAPRGRDAHGRLSAETGLVSETGRQGRVVPIPGRGGAGNGVGNGRKLGGKAAAGSCAGRPRPGQRVARLASQRPIVTQEWDAALGLEAVNRNLKTRKLTGCRPSR